MSKQFVNPALMHVGTNLYYHTPISGWYLPVSPYLARTRAPPTPEIC